MRFERATYISVYNSFLRVFFIGAEVLVLACFERVKVASYIPTLMLWTFSALIPLLVWYAGYWEKHWTISSTHFNIMQKCYGFLLLMVLIMPSLGSGALSLGGVSEKYLSSRIWTQWVIRYPDPRRCLTANGNPWKVLERLFSKDHPNEGLDLIF